MIRKDKLATAVFMVLSIDCAGLSGLQLWIFYKILTAGRITLQEPNTPLLWCEIFVMIGLECLSVAGILLADRACRKERRIE